MSDSSKDHKDQSSEVLKGEMSAKTTYQRSAKGPVSVSECSADGRYIAIENSARKPEALGGWQIQRVIDGASKEPFTFDANFSVKPGAKVKIWAKQKGPGAGRDDITHDTHTWGMGGNITTKLCNKEGEDKATHIQKTVYSSS